MKTLDIPLRQIVVLGDNVREDVGDVSELSDSIREVGLLQPLVVSGPTSTGHYKLICGHRRLAALQHLGMTMAPAVVRDVVTADERLEVMLTENLHRKTLSPLEEGRAFARMKSQRKLTQRQIAERMSVSPTYVANRLMLLECPKDVQRKVHRGEVNLEKALAPYRSSYQPRTLPTKPRSDRREVDNGQHDVRMPKELGDELYQLAEVCQREKYDYERAKAFAERLTAGLSPREAIATTVRLVETRKRVAS